jgi:hypothetical protein
LVVIVAIIPEISPKEKAPGDLAVSAVVAVDAAAA